MKVAILGCGPAGLIAAQAAVDHGHDVAIFSKRMKSSLYGAQYLHAPIPGLDALNSVRVKYVLRGTVDGYRDKVYDKQLTGGMKSSVEVLPEEHDAWDIRQLYDWLWSNFASSITPTDLHEPGILDVIVKAADLVVSSVPAPVLCLGVHQFQSQQVWAAGEAHDLGIKLPYNCPENTVICNGEEQPVWYRMSNIFGVKTVEWPFWVNRPPVGKPSVVNKPVRTNCDCWKQIKRVGRYGTWSKGVLSHEAYQATADFLNGGVQERLF